MRAYGKSDIGSVRKMNQDFMFSSEAPVGRLPNLFIVADGMGGHRAGDYASRMSVENFVDYVMQAQSGEPIRIVDDAMHYINEVVIDKASQHPELNGMGTTFVVSFILDQTLYVANVGDSRLYLIDQEIHQVTEDHSYVGAMVRAGEITRSEARNHPDKNIITRAIGVSKDLRVDFFEADLQPGDKILMCSDGLSNMVEDQELLALIKKYDLSQVTDHLIDTAKEHGGLDNITAIVIDPFDEEVEP